MIERFNGDFLQWLRGFYAVAETGNMSQAAERLGIRQPAVSYLIQCLEKELGVQLFNRKNKTMELTVEGRQLREKAITMFELVKEIQGEIGLEKQEECRGEISLSTTCSVSANILAQPLARFQKRHPRTWFTVNSCGESSSTLEMVNSSVVDFGVIAHMDFPATIDVTPLFSCRLVLVCRPGINFTRDSQGFLKNIYELQGVPFVFFSTASILNRQVHNILRGRGVVPATAASVNNAAVILSYIQANIGVTILEDFTVSMYKNTLDIYPLPGDEAVRKYSLITRRCKHLSPQSIACIESLCDDIGETKPILHCRKTYS